MSAAQQHAYELIQASPNLVLSRVFLAIQEGKAETIHELSKVAKAPVSSVCGRLAELMKQGLVRECGQKPGPYGKPNTTYRATV